MEKLHSNPTHAAAGQFREGGWKQAAFANELATLRSSLRVDVKGLAQKLGMSPAKVSRWLSESSDVCRQPTASDGIEIGLLEAATHGTNPFKACRRWLLLCGREMSDDEFNARLAEAESLEKHIEDAYDKLSRLLRRKTLEPAEARVALSAYFAQRECEDRIQQWLKRSNGIGNACFFWQWDNGKVVDRLTGKLLSATKGLFTLVCSPPNNLTESWDEPVQQEPQLGVCGFILDPGQDARSRLMEIEPVYPPYHAHI